MTTLDEVDREFPLGTKVWLRSDLTPSRWYVVVGVASGFGGAGEKRSLIALLRDGFVDHVGRDEVFKGTS